MNSDSSSGNPSEASEHPVSRQAFRRWVLLGYLLVLGVFALALAREFEHIETNSTALARERGNVLFRLIELTRDWNALHGGVYVRVSERTQPNPYLDHPKRDLIATDGTQLTMVNPAFMTRQIAEIAEKIDGVQFHITSLKPIRPANAPDPWETRALNDFEQLSLKEKIELIADPHQPVHRYMAPLMVKETCMRCHAKQGYQIGQIRGGISVTMPAGSLLGVIEKQRQRTLLSYGIVAVVVALLLHLVAARTYRHVCQLREIALAQEALVAERTQALSERNAQLNDEVAERRRKEAQIAESEARYRSVIQTSQDAILVVAAPDFRVTFANRCASTLFGLAPEQLPGQLLASLVVDRERERFETWLAHLANSGETARLSSLLLRQQTSGEIRVGEVFMAMIELPGEPQWVVNIHDVTARLAAERKLKIAAAVMENAAEGIMVSNADNQIIEVNPAFTAITGYRPSEVLGRNPRLLSSGRHTPEFFQKLWATLLEQGRWEGEIWNRRHDGAVFPEWLAITTISGPDGGAGGRYVATFNDISQRKEAEELLRHKAHTDPLTGLPNRSLFYDRLLMTFSQAKRYGEEFALIYLDLDRFKEVNDTLGHAAGDAVLVEVAQRLSKAVRDSDTVARLGGDEFAVILPKLVHSAVAEEVAERVVRAIAEPFALGEMNASLSASLGVAFYPRHGAEPEQLKRAADTALYQVKKHGRNGYQVYSPGSEAG